MKATALHPQSDHTTEMELNVVDIFIPAKEHIEHLSPDVLKPTGAWFGSWWLNSPGAYDDRAKYVDRDGNIDDYGHLVNGHYGVRPALRIDNMDAYDLQNGDEIHAAGYPWLVIADDMLLCKETIGHTPFSYHLDRIPNHPDNDYEQSDLLDYLKLWIKNIRRKGVDF